MPTYTAYGLRIASSLPIPELTPLDDDADAPDVVVELGDVPDALPGALVRTRGHESGTDGMRLQIDGVGRFLVRDGRQVLVSPDSQASEHDVRVYLLGSCFGALLHQRGALVLHASGIGTDRGAVLFAGSSGAGKSTLLAELLRRGHRMMVDDVCAIVATPGNDDLVVQPSYPRTRLWADTAELMAVSTAGLQQTRSHMDKFERQLPDQFWDRPAPLRRIYHLAPPGGYAVRFTPVPPMAVVPVVVADTYRQVFLDGFDIRQQHFDLASRIARSVPVVQVERPVDGFHVAEVADRILRDLAEDMTTSTAVGAAARQDG